MTDKKKIITVSVVEDNPEIRKSLDILISGSEGFKCISSYPNAEEAIRELPKKNPDVILMDINLPGASGIECVKKIKPLLSNSNIIMLTMYDDSEKVFEALSAGATGYLLKRTPPQKLIEAIKEVSEGGSPMSMQIARMVVKSFNHIITKDKVKDLLTDRENETLECLARGMRYQEIADNLFVSVDTVRTHIRKIYEKLHVHSKTEAVLKYLNNSK
ncbi:MAG: response regulator transcription factor [Bacteroidota bacterium]